MERTKKQTILLMLSSLGIALIFLLLTSKNSPFYPFNDWVDANAFFTTGKAMMHGVVPYLDLFEQKGLLLYFIYGLGSLITPTAFYGVFIFEVLTWAVFIYYLFKCIALFLPYKYGFLIIPILISLMCTSRAFTHGGGAEEFCLAFFGITLYYFLDHFKTKNITYKRLFIAGLCAGCALMIKYTILGFWFAFMAFIFFSLIKQKEYKKSIYACFIFLLGMFIPFLISLIYMAIHGGVKEFFDVYFFFNIASYGNKASLLVRIITLIKNVFNNFYLNGIFIMLLLFFMPFLTFKLNISKEGKIALLAMYLITILGIYWGLRFYRYYLFPILIFMIISLIVIASFIHSKKDISKYKISYITVFIFTLLFTYFNANYKELLFKPKKDLYQYQFANIINKEKNATMVNMGSLDCGVYTTSGIIPSTYYFQKQNIAYETYPYIIDNFQKYILNKETMFIVYYTKLPLEKLTEQELNLFINYDLLTYVKIKYENKTYFSYLFKVK